MMQTLTVGPLEFHLYGLILGIAIVVGWWLTSKRAVEAGVETKLVDRTVLWSVVGGIVGARLYHVVDLWEFYRNSWQMIFWVWQGGLGIWGAVVGGIVGLFAATYRHRRTRWILMDAAAMALPLAQAIGRWGNFVNYELYGKPTSLPWGIYIPPANRTEGILASHYHPLFLYESLLNLLLFGLLVFFKRRGMKLGSGKFLGTYLVGYGIIRMTLEPLRISVWRVGIVPMATLLAMAAVLIGFMLIVRKRNI